MIKKTYKRKGRRFTKADCRKGGSKCKGYETADDVRQRARLDAKGMVRRD